MLFVNQAVTSAILMIAVVGSGTAPERLSDALIGGGVALVITVIFFPAAPLPPIRDTLRTDGRTKKAAPENLTIRHPLQ